MRTKCTEPSASLLARKQCFVEVALSLFLERGFGETSVNEIVRQAGGSLATLYKLFPSKEDLFAAIISEHMLALYEPLKSIREDMPVEQVLLTLGRNYVKVASTPRSLALFRVMVLESQRFPQLREMFLSQGFAQLKSWMETFLQGAHDRGELVIPCTAMATTQFFGLVRAPWHLPAACGEAVDLSEERQEAIVQSATRAFLRAYAP